MTFFYKSRFSVGFCVYCPWLMQLAAYFYLARKWPELMKKWYTIDSSMQRVYGYPSSLDGRIKITTIAIFVAASMYTRYFLKMQLD